MKVTDPILPPLDNVLGSVVDDIQQVAVEHWWIFLVATAIALYFIAPRK